MTVLTDGERSALQNLASKGEGAITAFINIADAQRLTDLGLAQRTQQGWEITSAGTAYLARVAGGGHPDGVVDFKTAHAARQGEADQPEPSNDVDGD